MTQEVQFVEVPVQVLHGLMHATQMFTSTTLPAGQGLTHWLESRPRAPMQEVQLLARTSQVAQVELQAEATPELL